MLDNAADGGGDCRMRVRALHTSPILFALFNRSGKDTMYRGRPVGVMVSFAKHRACWLMALNDWP